MKFWNCCVKINTKHTNIVVFETSKSNHEGCKKTRKKNTKKVKTIQVTYQSFTHSCMCVLIYCANEIFQENASFKNQFCLASKTTKVFFESTKYNTFFK